jgi:DNA-binding SARP family transcriptional activator
VRTQELAYNRAQDRQALTLEEALDESGLYLPEESNYPVFIQMLGRFRLFKTGQLLTLLSGSKMEALLCILALHPEGVPRDSLWSALWPNHERLLAGQSLNSLVYNLRKLLQEALDGNAPVLSDGNSYRLNYEAGIAVDLDCFERLVSQGDRCWRQDEIAAARTHYIRALSLYQGDLCSITDVQAAVKRERLRVCYLGLVIRLADNQYKRGEYDSCLDLAGRVLVSDPCREDAHRLMMRCYVQRGERAQALRQYQLCVDILLAEYSAPPEAATARLYEQIRLTPNAV